MVFTFVWPLGIREPMDKAQSWNEMIFSAWTREYMFKGGNDVHTAVHCRLRPIWIRLLSIEHSNGIKQCLFSVRYSMANHLAFGIRSITRFMPAIFRKFFVIANWARKQRVDNGSSTLITHSLAIYRRLDDVVQMAMKMIFGRLPTVVNGADDGPTN